MLDELCVFLFFLIMKYCEVIKVEENKKKKYLIILIIWINLNDFIFLYL